MRTIALLAFLLCCIQLFGQQRIDDTFSFQTDPAKKYSLYIPSGYSADTPHRLMLGLHPLNTNRWDAESWCDTLIVFAETNNLILACPDGGIDGAVDDDIDTAFTTALLDSMLLWYNIDTDKTYAMGFSWGGKTTYTYGLTHANRFGGFLPIGSAVELSDIVPFSAHAANKPWYLVHGSADNPNVRFTPLRDELIAQNAFVETNLLSGVGHTIDFPDRNQILTVAYQWIDSVNCATIGIGSGIAPIDAPKKHLSKIRVSHDQLTFDYDNRGTNSTLKIDVLDAYGRIVQSTQQTISHGPNTLNIPVSKLSAGTYFFRVSSGNVTEAEKIMVN